MGFMRHRDPINHIPMNAAGIIGESGGGGNAAAAAGRGNAAHLNNLPIPIGMFMNMSNKPPRFYNQMQQQQQARGNAFNKGRFKGGLSQDGNATGGSQVTQSQQNGPMTQGGAATGHGSSATMHSQVHIRHSNCQI